MSDTVAAELAKWFLDRPKWLQEAARRLLKDGTPTSKDIDELVILCKREAGIEVPGSADLSAAPVLAEAMSMPNPTASLRLHAISSPEGINALGPRKPLEFGDEPLTIVYGPNGSGKSGYIRILKHACGGHGLGPLLNNAFRADRPAQRCNLAYTDSRGRTDLPWTPSLGVHAPLRGISIYDTDSAHVYITQENEVSFEPPLLAAFRALVEICEQVERHLSEECGSMKSGKPALPPEYAVSDNGKWFTGLTWQTSATEVKLRCDWSAAEDDEVAKVTMRLAETNPVARAAALRKTRAHAASLLALLQATSSGLTDEVFAALSGARANAAATRRAASVDAQRIFANPLLEGVASETWRLMWQQARHYSDTTAYPDKMFPYTDEDARCVLCQQSLDEPARDRLAAFEGFIKSGLEQQATDAEGAAARLAAALPECPIGPALAAGLDLAGVAAEDIRQSVAAYANALASRRLTLLTANAISDLAPMPSLTALDGLARIEAQYEVDAKGFDDDANGTNLPALRERLLNLQARKWVSQQRTPIEVEIGRLSAIHLLEAARDLTNTVALSKKKSTLAELLVTEAFQSRFSSELQALGAARVNAVIEKTKTQKGQVLHQLSLKDNTLGARTAEILSEGEFRVVSLAAFLADVAATGAGTPFIFDDPISSLDQDFEERAAARLVALAGPRQVIVFTHRLSLLAMLRDAATKSAVQCRIVSLTREPWGTGEPGEPPFLAQKPSAALNTLLSPRLSDAKGILGAKGTAAYQVQAKALCGDLRIVIEKLVENDLLADVIQRLRRPIHTQNKLNKLARISLSDCSLLDSMMTKYSRYEHAQPDEAPIPLPEPSEIEADILTLKTWLLEFSARPVPTS